MTVEIIELGDRVICDWCSKEFTDLPDTGGIMFQSKATCPECAPRIEKNAISYGEAWLIRARCPAGMSFHRWVVDVVRGGEPGRIKIMTGEDAPPLKGRG